MMKKETVIEILNGCLKVAKREAVNGACDAEAAPNVCFYGLDEVEQAATLDSVRAWASKNDLRLIEVDELELPFLDAHLLASLQAPMTVLAVRNYAMCDGDARAAMRSLVKLHRWPIGNDVWGLPEISLLFTVGLVGQYKPQWDMSEKSIFGHWLVEELK